MADYRGIEAFAEVKRLLVVAAHPDDLESMCGGTIALLVARGVEVYSVNCTLGDIGTPDGSLSRQTLATMRIEETGAAAKLLGLRAHYHLQHHDGELLPDLILRAEIAQFYRQTGADTLFTFDPYWTGQVHPDHRAAGQAALDAYMPAKMPLYHPEQLAAADTALGKVERIFLFATDRDPDIYIDVASVYRQKEAATLAHESQFPKGTENIEWMRELDRNAGQVVGLAYAERFKEIRVW